MIWQDDFWKEDSSTREKNRKKTNYRRWSNNPWSVVEPEGQPKAGAWTPDDAARLAAAVKSAHDAGLWIRFYTLDGLDPADTSGG